MRNRYREHSAVYHYVRKIEGSGGGKKEVREKEERRKERKVARSSPTTARMQLNALLFFFAISSLFPTVPSRSAFCH